MASVDNVIHEAKPVISPPKPFRQRIRLFLQLWAFKAFVAAVLPLARFFKANGMGKLKPTYTKRYPVAGRLVNDVWLPKNYKDGTKLPLLIDIHGGGFAIGDPTTDADYCDYLANEHGICVVSINYRKAPIYRFPQPIQDVTDVILKVLEDPDLPVDKTRVVVSGFSAGGNLALVSAFRDELQGKLKGLILFYPVTDFSGKHKGKYQTASDGTPDTLLRTSDMFNYGYVPVGQDRNDPRLSPIYGDRLKLPPKLFFIGAEHDILCHEAEITAKKYAEKETTSEKSGDENDWTVGGIRWLKVLDAQHGFNFVRKKLPQSEARRKAITKEVYTNVADWLKKEIYA